MRDRIENANTFKTLIFKCKNYKYLPIINPCIFYIHIHITVFRIRESLVFYVGCEYQNCLGEFDLLRNLIIIESLYYKKNKEISTNSTLMSFIYMFYVRIMSLEARMLCFVKRISCLFTH